MYGLKIRFMFPLEVDGDIMKVKMKGYRGEREHKCEIKGNKSSGVGEEKIKIMMKKEEN